MAADFSITGEVKLNSDPAEKATSKWTVAAGQLIADFAKVAASSLKSVVKSGLDYNAQMESYLTNFKVMLGDEQLAAEKLEEIRRMAASTPFSLSDLTEGTQTLLQFGIAADDTTGVLKRLGDISLGNADKLQTLVRAYGKMSSAQKVTLENVNMMIDAGFNPLNQICDATGESMSALYKRISDGKVSFNELEAAVAAATSEGGQFYNGMLEASQTFNGRLSTLKDNVAALTGELTSGLFSALGDIIVKANELVVSITEDDAKMAALKETIGVLTALHARELSGKGQRVDVALVDSVISSLETGTQRYFASGKLPRRIGNRYASAYPYDSFKAKDGSFVIGCGNDKLFNLLCTRVLHREDLLTDPRFLNNALRCENHAALKVEIEKWSTTVTAAEAYDAINAAGVPASPINDLHQISHDPHVVEDRQMFIPVKHPVIGDMRVNGNPVKLLDMMPEVVTCAPALGQHNEEIYGQLLGLDKEQLEALAEDHVI